MTILADAQALLADTTIAAAIGAVLTVAVASRLFRMFLKAR